MHRLRSENTIAGDEMEGYHRELSLSVGRQYSTM